MVDTIRRMSVLCISLMFVVFEAYAAESPRVVEGFTCNYMKGKGQKDLNSAVKYWQTETAKLDNASENKYFAAILTPLRSSTDADFFWLGGLPNLNEFAATTAEFETSKLGKEFDARMAKVATCKSNLWLSKPVYIGTPPGEGSDTDFVMEAYGCELSKGKNRENLDALDSHLRMANEAAKGAANVYRLSPFIATTAADVVYLVAHDDLKAFGASATARITANNGVGRHFGEVMRSCDGGLYNGKVVMAPAN